MTMTYRGDKQTPDSLIIGVLEYILRDSLFMNQLDDRDAAE